MLELLLKFVFGYCIGGVVFLVALTTMLYFEIKPSRDVEVAGGFFGVFLFSVFWPALAAYWLFDFFRVLGRRLREFFGIENSPEDDDE